MAAPELATQWNVVVNYVFAQQSAVTVVTLSGAEVHAAKVAADAAAAVALAAPGFTITGATGGNARFVNGTFSKTEEMQNGKPVYSKDGDAAMCCWYAQDWYWYVSNTTRKDANIGGGLAHSDEIGSAAPQLVPEWNVYTNGAYVLQPAVKVTNT